MRNRQRRWRRIKNDGETFPRSRLRLESKEDFIDERNEERTAARITASLAIKMQLNAMAYPGLELKSYKIVLPCMVRVFTLKSDGNQRVPM